MTRVEEHKKLETIQTEAAKWVARVYSGNASDADEEALSKWLALDERHRREYMRTLEVWDASGQMGLEDTVAAQTPARASIRDRLRGQNVAAIAALLLAAFVSAILFIGLDTMPFGTSVHSYATETGETREIKLSDGSHVTLNTGSRLYVDFSGNIRRAILDSGEAFFDVAKDASRPFVVTAGDQSVTVLGTQFNVYRQGATLTVAVVEGVVAVHENLEPEKLEQNARKLLEQPADMQLADFRHYRLEAGSVGTFEKSIDLQGDVAVADADSHQSWRQGIVRFADSSLADVVDELSRYSENPIYIADSDLADLNISGVFHHDDIAGILAGLEALLPISVTHEGDQIVISSTSED